MVPLLPADLPENSSSFVFGKYYDALPRDPSICPKAPPWRLFDPLNISSALPDVAVLKCDGTNVSDAVPVIIGEGQQGLIFYNEKDKPLKETLSPKMKEARLAALNAVRTERAPSFHISSIPFARREFVRILRSCFPFCGDDGEVSHLVVVAEQLSNFPMLEKIYGPRLRLVS